MLDREYMGITYPYPLLGTIKLKGFALSCDLNSCPSVHAQPATNSVGLHMPKDARHF